MLLSVLLQNNSPLRISHKARHLASYCKTKNSLSHRRQILMGLKCYLKLYWKHKAILWLGT